MVIKGALLFIFLLGGIFSALICFLLLENEPQEPQIVDKWWGKGLKSAVEKDEVPRIFKLDVPQAELDDLNSKLDDENFEYGKNHDFLKQFTGYWRTKYDWRKEEKKINKFPQYLLKISGIDIHYVYAKPQNPGTKKVMPILISHGLPASVLELYNVIEQLMTPKKDQDFVYEVICPSIPGYGFSEAAHKPGLNFADTALIYTKLMTKLGHKRFYVQDGDWGSAIVSTLAVHYPDRVLGLQLNMAMQHDSISTILRWALGSSIPSTSQAAEIGSPGAGLSDSPLGLAAYILDHFADATSMDKAAPNFDDGLDALNKDELISNLMVYWFSHRNTSTVGFDKEAMKWRAMKIGLMVLKGALLFIFLIGGILSALICYLLVEREPPKPQIVDKWWGKGLKPAVEKDEVPRTFKLDVPQAELDDLNSRLKNARFSKGLEGINFEYGMNHDFLKQFAEYWRTKYDWRKEEKRINKFPQYLLKISGIDIHYVHARPQNPGTKKVVPILISHGWPGSVLEFYNVIELLRTPRKDQGFVFEVICPSIPGYGFSEAAHKPGLNFADTALIYTKLMTKLGHKRFYIQGGDWGSAIVSTLAVLYPDRVLGLHLNMAMYHDSISTILRWVLGSFIPSMSPAAEIGSPGMYPISNLIARSIAGSGYFHLQATFPDSLGAGLNDSPLGLAAYILDKFAFATNMDKAAGKFDGGLDALNKDELISNLMVYWFSQSITSSVRFYKEAMKPEFRAMKIGQISTQVPTGFLLCDREPLLPVTALGWPRYKNIIRWEKSSKCGHFAAMEDPKGFAEQIWRFVTLLEN